MQSARYSTGAMQSRNKLIVAPQQLVPQFGCPQPTRKPMEYARILLTFECAVVMTGIVKVRHIDIVHIIRCKIFAHDSCCGDGRKCCP